MQPARHRPGCRAPKQSKVQLRGADLPGRTVLASLSVVVDGSSCRFSLFLCAHYYGTLVGSVPTVAGPAVGRAGCAPAPGPEVAAAVGVPAPGLGLACGVALL